MQRRQQQVQPIQLQVPNNTSSQPPSTGQINNSNLLPIHSSNTTTNALSVLGGLTVDKSRLKNRKSRLIHLGNAGTKQELLTEFDQICEELTIDPKIESFQILSAIRQFVGMKMPDGWTKEIDLKQKIIYVNAVTKDTFASHPFLANLKRNIGFLREVIREEEIERKGVVNKEVVEVVNSAIKNQKVQSEGNRKGLKAGSPRKETLPSVEEKPKIPSVNEFADLGRSPKESTTKNQSITAILFNNQTPQQTPRKEVIKQSLYKLPSIGSLQTLPNKNSVETSPRKRTIPIGEAKTKDSTTQKTPPGAGMDGTKLFFLTNHPLPNEHLLPQPKLPQSNAQIEIKILSTEPLPTKISSQIQKNQQFLNLSTVESYYHYSTVYYRSIFPRIPFKIPKEISSGKDYRKIDVFTAMRLFAMFNLAPGELWMGKWVMLYLALPLPPDITIPPSSSTDSAFIYKAHLLQGVYRPGYQYIMDVVNELKGMNRFERENYDQLLPSFYDQAGRLIRDCRITELYTEYLNGMHAKKSKRLANPILQDSKLALETSPEDMPGGQNDIEDLGLFKDPLSRKVHEIMAKSYGGELAEDITSNTRDMHFVVIFKQLGLSPQKDLHLMFVIEDFVHQKNREKLWNFRVREDGKSVYWINLKEHQASLEYPFLDELKNALEEYKQKQASGQGTDSEWPAKYLRSNDLLKNLLKEPISSSLETFKTIRKTILNCLTSFLTLDMLPAQSSPTDPNSSDQKQPKSTSTRVNELKTIWNEQIDLMNSISNVRISPEDFNAIIFFCRFDLEKYIKLVCRPNLSTEESIYIGNRNPVLPLEDKIKDFIRKKMRSEKMARKISLEGDDMFLGNSQLDSSGLRNSSIVGHPTGISALKLALEENPELYNYIDPQLRDQSKVIFERTGNILSSVDNEFNDVGEALLQGVACLEMAVLPEDEPYLRRLIKHLGELKEQVENQQTKDRFAEAKAAVLSAQAKQLEDYLTKKGGIGLTMGTAIRVHDVFKRRGRFGSKNNPGGNGSETNIEIAGSRAGDREKIVSQTQHFLEARMAGSRKGSVAGSRALSNSSQRVGILNTNLRLRQESKDKHSVTSSDSSISLHPENDSSESDTERKLKIEQKRSSTLTRRQSSIGLGRSDSINSKVKKRNSLRTNIIKSGTLHLSIASDQDNPEPEILSATTTHGLRAKPTFHSRANSFREDKSNGLVEAFLQEAMKARENQNSEDPNHSSTAVPSALEIVNKVQSKPNTYGPRTTIYTGNLTNPQFEEPSPNQPAAATAQQRIEEIIPKAVLLEILKLKGVKASETIRKIIDSKVSSLVITEEQQSYLSRHLGNSVVEYLRSQKIEGLKKVIANHRVYRVLKDTALRDNKNRERTRVEKLRKLAEKTYANKVEVKFRKRNLFKEVYDELVEQAKILNHELEIKPDKNIEKSKNLLYAKSNQRLKQEILSKPDLKENLEKFIVEFLKDFLPDKDLRTLNENDGKKRKELFEEKEILLEMAIHTILHKPTLYKLATDFIFEKLSYNDIDWKENTSKNILSQPKYHIPATLKCPQRLLPNPFKLDTSKFQRSQRLTEAYSIVDLHFPNTSSNNITSTQSIHPTRPTLPRSTARTRPSPSPTALHISVSNVPVVNNSIDEGEGGRFDKIKRNVVARAVRVGRVERGKGAERGSGNDLCSYSLTNLPPSKSTAALYHLYKQCPPLDITHQTDIFELAKHLRIPLYSKPPRPDLLWLAVLLLHVSKSLQAQSTQKTHGKQDLTHPSPTSNGKDFLLSSAQLNYFVEATSAAMKSTREYLSCLDGRMQNIVVRVFSWVGFVDGGNVVHFNFKDKRVRDLGDAEYEKDVQLEAVYRSRYLGTSALLPSVRLD